MQAMSNDRVHRQQGSVAHPRMDLVTHLSLIEARGVPGEMAEQHGAPEQAAAGKSHGGLGGNYKVLGREGTWGLWAQGCSWASGSASLQKGVSWGQEDTSLPSINSLYDCCILPLLCPCLQDGTGHTHPAHLNRAWRPKAFRSHGTDSPADLSPVLSPLWASKAPSLKWE